MEMSRKGGQRKRAAAQKLRDQVRRNVAADSKTPAQRAAKAAVTKRGGTTITYKPKSSPHLKPKPAAKKVAPAFSRGGSTPGAGLKKRLTTIREKARKPASATKPKAGIAPKRGSLTAAQKQANAQRRKNLRSEIEGL